MRRTLEGTVAVVIAAALAGCGASFPVPPTAPGGAAASSAGGEAPGMDDPRPRPATLYPGDVITVRTVSAETTELEGLVVDESGRVHLPLAGDVQVGGLELAAAEGRLEEALRQFDRFARVSVRITDPAGHRMTVLGAVTRPGEVRIAAGMRISDAVASVGGPLGHVSEAGEDTQLADLEAATLYRDGERLPVSVARALEGHPRHDVRVRPGDQLFVPSRPQGRISVLGEVGGATPVAYRPGLRLTEALAAAGGATIRADEADIRILRGPPARPDVYAASLDDIADGMAHDPVLAPGDVVYVSRSGGAELGEALSQIGPILTAMVTIGLTVAVIMTTTR